MQKIIHSILKTRFHTLAVHWVKCAAFAHIPKTWIYSHGYQITGFNSNKLRNPTVCVNWFFFEVTKFPSKAWKASELISLQQFQQVCFQPSSSTVQARQANMESSDIIHFCLWFLCLYIALSHFFSTSRKNVGVTLWQMSKLKWVESRLDKGRGVLIHSP